MSQPINLLPSGSALHGVVSRTFLRWWAAWICIIAFVLTHTFQLRFIAAGLAAKSEAHVHWLSESRELESQLREASLHQARLREELDRPIAVQTGFPTLSLFDALIQAIDQAVVTTETTDPPAASADTSSDAATPYSDIVIDSLVVEPAEQDSLNSFRVSLVATCPSPTAAQQFVQSLTSVPWIKEVRRPSFPRGQSTEATSIVTLEFLVAAGLFGDTP